jgi:hypothetical protein
MRSVKPKRRRAAALHTLLRGTLKPSSEGQEDRGMSHKFIKKDRALLSIL